MGIAGPGGGHLGRGLGHAVGGEDHIPAVVGLVQKVRFGSTSADQHDRLGLGRRRSGSEEPGEAGSEPARRTRPADPGDESAASGARTTLPPAAMVR